MLSLCTSPCSAHLAERVHALLCILKHRSDLRWNMYLQSQRKASFFRHKR